MAEPIIACAGTLRRPMRSVKALRYDRVYLYGASVKQNSAIIFAGISLMALHTCLHLCCPSFVD